MSFLIAKAPYWITRFGEMGIVLPLAAALAWWMAAGARSIRPALGWLVMLALAVVLTSLSKIAFIGWGLGIATLDFTGFSGHAMFAAAIYPVLAYVLATQAAQAPWPPRLALLCGYALALLIAWSRVHIQVHSWSEVVAGFALGALASGWAVWRMDAVPQRPPLVPLRWAWLGLAGWLSVMPLHATPSRSHDMVTRLALLLSAHDAPFRRANLQRSTLPGP